MGNDAPWAGDENTRRWDFAGEPASTDEWADSVGYEAALPGLQWLYAHDAPVAPRAAEGAP